MLSLAFNSPFFLFLPRSWNALIYYFNTVSCLLCHSKIFYLFSGSIMLCTKRRVSSISQGEDVGTRDHDLDSSARNREEPVGNKNVAGGGISLPVHRSAWWVSTDNSIILNCKPASLGRHRDQFTSTNEFIQRNYFVITLTDAAPEFH